MPKLHIFFESNPSCVASRRFTIFDHVTSHVIKDSTSAELDKHAVRLRFSIDNYGVRWSIEREDWRKRTTSEFWVFPDWNSVIKIYGDMYITGFHENVQSFLQGNQNLKEIWMIE